VVNARFIKPLDEDLLLESAARTGRLVTVEENVLSGGFGAAVLELLERNGVRDVKVRRVGLPDEFVPHGKQELLRSLYHLDAEGIAAECLDFLGELQPERRSPLSWRGA
jgi:1-deoxy-D-xylulose-5-phosphate synthase